MREMLLQHDHMPRDRAAFVPQVGQARWSCVPRRRCPEGRGSDARGFTLVEILITISIITMLLGLLLPVLAGVRNSGRAIQCQSNLRQMSLAAHAYSTKYRAYPIALQFDNSDGVFKSIAWDWVTTASGELISPGPLWQFTDDPGEVMQCPQYLGNSPSAGDPYTGFNYSTYLGGEEQFSTNPQGNIKDGAAPGQIRRPAMTAMFGLGGTATGTNKYMRSPRHHQHSEMQNLALQTIYAGAQAFRYQGSTFVAYADGRIGSVEQPRKGELATDALLQQMGWPNNGFLSDDASAYRP